MEQVMVVLSSYNGEKYIRAQIDSVLAQEGVSLRLLVRDDGSTDGTRSILNEYAAQGKLEWYTGENLGPAGSFADLLTRAGEASYCALCDQDDYWMPDKLSTALEMLKTVPEGQPAMYYGNPTLADENLQPLPVQNALIEAPDLRKGIFYPLVQGCTMVMNRALTGILNLHPCRTLNMHDYWIHKVCLLVGGTVLCDQTSHILYRQHGNNAAGGNQSMAYRVRRYVDMFRKSKGLRTGEVRNIAQAYGSMLTEEAEEVLRDIEKVRGSLKDRIRLAGDRRYYSGFARWDLLFRIAVLTGSL